MSKPIPLSYCNNLRFVMQQISDAYFLREALIARIKEKPNDIKSHTNEVFKFSKDLVGIMKDDKINSQLEADELIAIAECRIKKANVLIQELACKLNSEYGILIEDPRQ